MTTTQRLGVLIALTAVSLFTPRAEAAIAAAATFDQKVDNAAAIIMGRCVKTESRFDPTGRWILTYSTFDVEKSIKGSTGQQVTLVVPGGEVDGIRQETIGVPTFQRGDENVLFLKNTSLGPTVLYFDQGAYDVRNDGGEKMIAPVASNLVKVDAQSGKATAADDEPRTISAFDHAVRESIQSGPDRRMRMAAMRGVQKKPQRSLWSILAEQKLLVALALIGAALATWQLLRR